MKVVKNNVTAQIIAYMKENIEDGTWRCGEMIPSENVLTRELGVSRASVRAAIQQFIALGIMESRHGKGTFLKSSDLTVFGHPGAEGGYYSFHDIMKSLEYRMIIEKGAVALAAEHITEETLERLRQELERMRENVGNSEEFVRCDMAFHQEIAKASDNMLLYHGLNEVLTSTVDYHRQLNHLVGYQNGIYYHTLILEALEKQDGRKAAQLMEKHLQTTRKEVENYQEQESGETKKG